MMFKFKFVLLGVLVACFTVMPAANASRVTGYSKLGYDSNSENWKIAANCSGSKEPRILISKEKNGPWCAEELPSVCDRNRLRALNKICLGSFKRDAALYAEQQSLIQQEEAEKRRASLRADLIKVQERQKAISDRKSFLNARMQELIKRNDELEQQIISLIRP